MTSQHCHGTLRLGYGSFMSFDSGTSLMVVLWRWSPVFAMKGGSPQTWRRGGDADVIFEVDRVTRVQKCPQHTTQAEATQKPRRG